LAGLRRAKPAEVAKARMLIILSNFAGFFNKTRPRKLAGAGFI